MAKQFLLVLAVLALGSFAADQTFAQMTSQVTVFLPGGGINDIGEIQTLDASALDEFTLLHDQEMQIGKDPTHLGKDDEVTCGFCGTNGDDEEMPFESGKTIIEEVLEVYPNPATDFLHIRGGGHLIAIQLLSADGRLVRSYEQPQTEIMVDDLAPGLYVLRLDAGYEVTTRKIVVQ